MTYLDELKRGCEYLAKDPKTIFLGQAVGYKGTGLTGQLANVDTNQKLELPVTENMQAGLSLGLWLTKSRPVCLYPRFDFLILALDQIINHIDCWSLMTDGLSVPQIIFKVAVGSVSPLDPGWQHKANHSNGLRQMLRTIKVIELNETSNILNEYKEAYERVGSTILVEFADKYSSS